MAKRQITLPGRRKDGSSIGSSSDLINIDLDDQDGKRGMSISFDLYKEMVKEFNSPSTKLRDNEKVAYIVDRQLLHILLSSSKCCSLLLSKCIRADRKESIALLALDSEGRVIGTKQDPASHDVTLVDAASDVPAGEWIQGLTATDLKEKGVLTENAFGGQEFNFGKYLSAMAEKATK